MRPRPSPSQLGTRTGAASVDSLKEHPQAQSLAIPVTASGLGPAGQRIFAYFLYYVQDLRQDSDLSGC